MSKEKNTFKEAKQPKTVQVKMLVPYGIIIAIVLVAAGLFTGWTLRSDFQGAIQREVTEQVSQLKDQQ